METGPKSTPNVEQFPRPTVALEDVKTPEDLLNAVDFNVVNDIFDSLERKSGPSTLEERYKISPERITIEYREEVKNDKGIVERGNANAATGTATVFLFKDLEGEVTLPQILKGVKSLLHESAHIRGGYKTHEYEGIREGEEIGSATSQSGLAVHTYEATVKDGVQETKIGTGLNEAITESLAIEVFHEYLKRTGNAHYLHDALIIEKMGGGSYLKDRIALGAIIDALARKLQVHRQEVWKGMVQTYMNASDSAADLMTEMLTELEDAPAFADLMLKLSEDKSLEVSTVSINDICEAIENPVWILSTLDKVAQAFDAKKIENALHLR